MFMQLLLLKLKIDAAIIIWSQYIFGSKVSSSLERHEKGFDS